MSNQPLTLNIPDVMYQQLKQRAEQSERSIEDETLDVLAGVVPSSAQLPDDLAADIDAVNSLDDANLWDIARSRLAAEVSEELEALHLKQQREGLLDNEQQQLAGLRRQYERHLLKRAQAIALLKQRNHDVSHLISS
jgi:plasmid stability protein